MRLAIGHRNVLILATCQAVVWSSASIMIISVALTGSMLGNEALATLPLGLQFTATMLTTYLASVLMRWTGRRWGFTLGAVSGIASGLISAWAVFAGSFVWFCIGGMFMGAAMSFAQYYRFAAAESAEPAFRSRAISLVIGGGVISALAGPELARWARDLFAPVLFAGSYVVIAALFVVAAVLLQFLRVPPQSSAEPERAGEPSRRPAGRPLAEIVRQPVYIVAVAGGVIGYGMMMLVMTATPLAMVACGYEFGDATFVIQWHALAMFVPSFFTGWLISRFGVLNVMLAGTALAAGCVVVDLSGISLAQFWGGLVLVGLGWNFLFIGATTLLTGAYRPEERAKAQGLNDSLVFGLVALTSFGSGWLQNQFGWAAVNLAGIGPLALVVLALLWLRQRRPREVGQPA